jgi:hypothetical protein
MSRPGRFTPRKNSQYQLWMRLGKLRGRPGRVGREHVLQMRAVRNPDHRPLASRYADHATPAAATYLTMLNSSYERMLR